MSIPLQKNPKTPKLSDKNYVQVLPQRKSSYGSILKKNK